MLPYDGEPVQAPSTSAWTWDPTYSLYFNHSTQQWAKPRPDGGWDYAGGDDSAAVTVQPQQPRDDESLPVAPAADQDDHPPRADDRTSHRAQVSYGDVDQAPSPTTVPEEQLWPASDDDDPDPADRFSSAPLLRLVVQRRPDPTVLPLAHTVASLDPAEPVSIGRDKSFERRIRLRELAVSKTHCTLFWASNAADPDAAASDDDDGKGGYWAVVDNASTHGTFVADERGENEVRLSDPKVASTPRRLHHLDTIRMGSTTFAVHIHASFACTACTVASDSSNLIPLVASPSDSAPPAPAPAYTGSRTKAQKEQDRREQMALLRGKLLKPAPGTSSSSSTTAASSSAATASTAGAAKTPTSSPFIDRAAARRERNAHAAPTPFFAVPGRTASATAAAAAPASAPPARPAPADPFASDSRGARLLGKLSGAGAGAAGGVGGASGAGAGAGAGLGTLVEARTYAGEARDVRPGLGSRALVVGVERVGEARSVGGPGAGAGDGKRDWRGEGRERSYKRLREGA
ncbi:hypothetical protein JCM9279_007402 [Rhodotorula babjevae]